MSDKRRLLGPIARTVVVVHIVVLTLTAILAYHGTVDGEGWAEIVKMVLLDLLILDALALVGWLLARPQSGTPPARGPAIGKPREGRVPLRPRTLPRRFRDAKPGQDVREPGTSAVDEGQRELGVETE